MSTDAPARARVAPPAAADSHPRIRERQAAVARGHRRRRLRRLNVVLAIVCIGVWALVGVRSSLVDVDHVRVEGAERTTADDVRAAAGIARGDALVGVDLDGAQRAVAALPWVDEARVTRSWPGTVRVELTERTAVAVVATPEGSALLDRTGRVLAVVDDVPDGLVRLAGERAVTPGATLDDADDRAVLAAVAGLPASLRDATTRALDGPDGVELALTDGFQVVLGDRGELAAKVEAAEAVRQHAEPEGAWCRIDVRVPSAPVLTRGMGCA